MPTMSIGDQVASIVVRASERIETSWKNGGGLAREVYRLDDEEGWIWRLSSATVSRDGPFSLFPGYDRLLMLTDGRPMHLDFEDGERLLVERGAAHVFSCDRPVSARLQDTDCEDLNLIWRRRDLSGRGGSFTAFGTTQQVVQPALWHIYHVLSGRVDMTAGPSGLHALHAGDTIVLHDPSNSERFQITIAAEEAECVALTLSPS